MASKVAILEDEAGRREAMRLELANRLPECRLHLFDSAPVMIAWLRDHLPEVVFVSLDHDLGATRKVDGVRFDPGVGRDVAEYLATQSPICPVIIHSTNRSGAVAMKSVLQSAGWPVSSVVPMNDTSWVRDAWGPEISRLRECGLIFE